MCRSVFRSFTCNALESKEALLHILSLAGSPPAPGKTKPPRSAFIYLGAVFDFTDVLTDQVVHCGPTTASVCKIRDAVHIVVSTRSLTPAQASKLPGQAGWAGSLLHGKCGRLALRFLKSRQYSGDKDSTVNDFAARELQLLLLIAEQAPARSIPILQTAKRPVVIYSDASFQNGQARCGWVVFRQDCRPVGQTVKVNSEWLAAWNPRETQIFAAEAFCSLLVPFNLPDLLADQDLLWFVDNEAAASAMIRGSSGSTDVDQIVQLSSILLLRLRARLWIEWINSDANPSDGRPDCNADKLLRTKIDRSLEHKQATRNTNKERHVSTIVLPTVSSFCRGSAGQGIHRYASFGYVDKLLRRKIHRYASSEARYPHMLPLAM